ncbi:hypothetical protein AX14_011392 [Amanita brunnescens Koide BX004]|nr:hypothetical protein AX14_011392 [Amanita brunnescens Koide BX004]
MAHHHHSSNKKAPTPFTYPDAVLAFNDQNVQVDLAQACEKLAKATASLLSKFDAIAAQLHKLDTQDKSNPSGLRPRWNTMHRDFQQLMWQTRTNANFISGRLKLFSASVLPLVARDASGSPSRRLIDEKLQVVSSFMSISADNANLTRSLAGQTLHFGSALNTVHTEVAKSAGQKVGESQKEVGLLVRKLSDLDSVVQKVCAANIKLAMPDIGHLVYSVFRIIATSLRRPGRSKVCHKRVSLRKDVLAIGSLYEQLDQTYNEVAHVQYAVQTGPARSDVLVNNVQTHLALLVSDVMLTTESVISLFLAIWARLQCDCTEMLYWLKGAGENGAIPPCISVYAEQGKTLYAGIASGLDVFVSGLDPSWFTQLSQK